MVFAVVAILHIVNRLGLIGSAFTAADHSYRASIVCAVAASSAWAAERAITTFDRNRRESALAAEVLTHILSADALPDAARAEYDAIVVGIFEQAKATAQLWPSAVGDATAAVAACAIAALCGWGLTLIVFLVGMAAGFLAVTTVRQRTEALSRRAWQLRERYGQRILDALEGAHELTISFPPGRYEALVASGLREQRRLSWFLALESMIVGRAPMAVGVASACLLTVIVSDARFAHVGEWAVLLSMLPPFAGVATTLTTYVELKPALSALKSLRARPTRKYGTQLPARMTPLVLDDVDVRYGKTMALESISAQFKGFVGVTGPNGSGKSTLLRLLAGLEHTTTGRFMVDELSHDVVDWPRARLRIGYLPQRPYFPPLCTVREGMRFLLGEVADEDMRVVLERVGIWGVLAEKSPSDPLEAHTEQLSIGERQRVALARVFARNAELYLLDEPDANLDRRGVDWLAKEVRAIAKHATVIVVAHDSRLVDGADHRFRLERGRLSNG